MAGEEAYLERAIDPRAAMLDDPYVRKLMAQALKVAGVDLKKGNGQVVLRSTIAAPHVAR